MKRKIYNILLSFNDIYASRALELLFSLKNNNKDALFHVYIYYLNLSEKSFKKIDSFIKENDIGKIELVKYPKKIDLSMKLEHTSVETYMRLLVPFFLNKKIERILYLDCDIVCNGKIDELYNTNIDDYYVAGVLNKAPLDKKDFNDIVNKNLDLPITNKYINAGVLLINVKNIIRNFKLDYIEKYIVENHEKSIMQDQDIINKLFYKKIKHLPNKYNYQINGYTDDKISKTSVLIHYSDSLKPWRIDYNSMTKASFYFDNLRKYGTISSINTKKKSKVDIIIPVYNSIKTLKKALDSINILVNKDELTVYIIDDYSNDNYDKIIKDYIGLLNIVYHKLDCNMGPGFSRNHGIKMSYSDYIVFLDSDDYFSDENSIKVLIDCIEKENADEVRSTFVRLSKDDKTIFKNDSLGLHGKIYKRSFIEKNYIFFSNTRSYEDTYFNTSIYLKGGKILDIANNTYFWVERDNSLSKTEQNKQKLLDYAMNMYNSLLYYKSPDKNLNINVIFDTLYYIYSNKVLSKEIIAYINKIIGMLENMGYNLLDLVNIYSIESKEEFINFYKNSNEYEKYIRTFDATDVEEKNKFLKDIFASYGTNNIVEVPINTNCGGKNVHIGSGIYINFGLSLVDNGNIYIDDGTFIGPNVTIATLNHPVELECRLDGNVEIKDVRIGKNVWVGAGVIILPGVRIGDNSVIGAGSVVNKNIPSNVLACGNPCKVIKKINN